MTETAHAPPAHTTAPKPKAAPPPSAPPLSDRELAGQRLVVAFPGTTPSDALRHAIADGDVAGVILYGDNIVSVAQTRALVDELQAIPRPKQLDAPLLIATDQEGGEIRRFTDEPPAQSAQEMAANDSPSEIEHIGRATGHALREAGVTVDLAPVADVAHPDSELVHEERVFGDEPSTTGAAAAAFARGLVAAHVQATAKHFPGLGGATANTDLAPVTIDLSATELRATDEHSFVPVIDAGARLVMVSNAIYPALDPDLPASQSQTIATGELRDRLGFHGVSITDDLGAAALKPYGDPGALAVRSARAGIDLELIGNGFLDPLAAADDARVALAHAIASGALPRAAAQASLDRVLALRRLSATP